MKIPEAIMRHIAGQKPARNTIGRSGADIFIYEDTVLKIEKVCEEAEREYRMMRWLEGKAPVPKVVSHELQDGRSFLLMTKAEGEISCTDSMMENADALLDALADGLRGLWTVDLEGCPETNLLQKRLTEAERAVASGLVGTEDAEPGTYGPGGFSDPEALLSWLLRNRPEEETVLSHGDFCMPNIFLKDGRVSGYIDLGRCGAADPYQDIALLLRSLHHNYAGLYGGPAYPDFDPMRLFSFLEMRPDPEKIRYYILLDELF